MGGIATKSWVEVSVYDTALKCMRRSIARCWTDRGWRQTHTSRMARKLKCVSFVWIFKICCETKSMRSAPLGRRYLNVTEAESSARQRAVTGRTKCAQVLGFRCDLILMTHTCSHSPRNRVRNPRNRVRRAPDSANDSDAIQLRARRTVGETTSDGRLASHPRIDRRKLKNPALGNHLKTGQ